MALNYNFSGKTVLITGGSKGIGLKLLENLAECDAKVISLSRSVENIESIKNKKPNLRIEGIKCDISKWDDVKSVLNSLPHVDCLVNNAGLARLRKFGEIQLEEIDEVFNVNVKAIINISQIITNDWKSRGFSGVIVNVSSQVSKRAIKDHTIYSASKAAIDSVTRSMALELGPFNIRVNSVNPTAILTDMGRLYWENKEMKESLTSRLPLGRLGEEQEAVDVIMYLLSDRCSLVTGASIPVDGGFWAC